MTRLLRRDCRGFSITEVTTILVAMTILSGLSVPAITDYIEDAKLVRARHDVATLGVSLVRLFNDVGAERARPRGWATYVLLVGSGQAPGTISDSAAWAAAVGGDVGGLDDQLVTNGAGYTTFRPGERRGWRGAYLQQAVGPDPWDHRYAVNVGAMRQRDSDTFVVSAGPDGVVMLPFDIDGLRPAGDDIVSIVSSGGVIP